MARGGESRKNSSDKPPLTRSTNADLSKGDVTHYLEGQSELDLLRFITCGSVDDGKSTLIGRMLYEAQLVFDDHIIALERDSRTQGTQGDEIDFALLVDGLSARENRASRSMWPTGILILINVSLLLSDTPGHEQYIAIWPPGLQQLMLQSFWLMPLRAS